MMMMMMMHITTTAVTTTTRVAELEPLKLESHAQLGRLLSGEAAAHRLLKHVNCMFCWYAAASHKTTVAISRIIYHSLLDEGLNALLVFNQ